MSFYSEFTSKRRLVADRLLGPIHRVVGVDADEITRISGWLCFLGAGALLLEHFVWAAGFVLAALIFDTLDGTYARLQGKSGVQTDWAMDRFTEAILTASLAIASRETIVSWIFVVAFVVNIFLPTRRVPILPLRLALAMYCAYFGWRF